MALDAPMYGADINMTAWMVVWNERERGWGIRPDGFSFHESLITAKKYISDYWADMPDEVPAEYSAPEYSARLVVLKDEQMYERVASEKSVRVFSNRDSDFYEKVVVELLNAL